MRTAYTVDAEYLLEALKTRRCGYEKRLCKSDRDKSQISRIIHSRLEIVNRL